MFGSAFAVVYLCERTACPSHIVFQRRQVSDAVWLPSELSYSAGGRVLLVRKLRVEGMREYSDYEELGVDGLTALWQPHPGK